MESTDFEHEQEDEHEHEKRISQRPLARPNPKRGSGLSVLNRWAGAEGKFVCRRAFRAFNTEAYVV